MCGLKAFEAGCAVLAINDQSCNSSAKLRDLILELEQKPSKGRSMKVTLCFSKYSDFSEVNQSRIRLRRRDGDTYIFLNITKTRNWKVGFRRERIRHPPPPTDEEPTSWVGYPFGTIVSPMLTLTVTLETQPERWYIAHFCRMWN
jgi:hypothetical protein